MSREAPSDRSSNNDSGSREMSGSSTSFHKAESLNAIAHQCLQMRVRDIQPHRRPLQTMSRIRAEGLIAVLRRDHHSYRER